MISRTLLLASGLLAAAALGACSDVVAPRGSVNSAAFARAGGSLHLTKDCSTYTGQAGEICTVTSSSIRQIEVGSTITYESAAVGVALDTHITIDLPGLGNNQAFGHCTLSLATGIGVCRIIGGTGKFRTLRALVDVSNVGGANFEWSGTYSFDPHN
jgi:hypothetical protein